MKPGKRWLLAGIVAAAALAGGSASAEQNKGAGKSEPVQLSPDICTESGDSAPAIQAALAGVPNGSTVKFPFEARCRVELTVDLSIPPAGEATRRDTQIDLNGTLIFRDEEPSCEKLRACNGPIVDLHEVEGVWLYHGTIRGGLETGGGPPLFDATREHDHGVALHGVTDTSLSYLTIENVGGDCVDIDRSEATPSSNVHIEANASAPFTCRMAGRQGISANEVDGLQIIGIVIDRVSHSGIDLEGRHLGYIRNVTLEGNKIGWAGNYAIAGIGAAPEWSNVVIARNEQTDAAHIGLGFMNIGNGIKRGPVSITENRGYNVFWIKNTGGEATKNLLLEAPRGPDCMFQVDEAPLLRIAPDNSHPKGTALECAALVSPPWVQMLGALIVLAMVGGSAAVALRYRRKEEAPSTGGGSPSTDAAGA